MDRRCKHLQPLLPEWVDGALETGRATELAAHVGSCVECSALVEVLRRDLANEGGISDPALTSAILEHTSGSPCARALDQLVDYSDGGLESAPRELMGLHLEHCPHCSPVGAVLQWMPTVLEEMRELAPDENFLAEVLAATVGGEVEAELDEMTAEPGRWSRGLAALDRRLEQLLVGARGLTARPMFTVEAAYVATVVAALLVATPASPYKELPRQALDWLQGRPPEGRLAGPFGEFRDGAGELTNEVAEEASGRFARWRGAVYNDLSARGQGGFEGLKGLGSAANGLRLAFMGEEGHQMGPALSAVSDAVRQLWQGISQGAAPAEGEQATDSSSPQARQERGP